MFYNFYFLITAHASCIIKKKSQLMKTKVKALIIRLIMAVGKFEERNLRRHLILGTSNWVWPKFKHTNPLAKKRNYQSVLSWETLPQNWVSDGESSCSLICWQIWGIWGGSFIWSIETFGHLNYFSPFASRVLYTLRKNFELRVNNITVSDALWPSSSELLVMLF